MKRIKRGDFSRCPNSGICICLVQGKKKPKHECLALSKKKKVLHGSIDALKE